MSISLCIYHALRAMSVLAACCPPPPLLAAQPARGLRAAAAASARRLELLQANVFLLQLLQRWRKLLASSPLSFCSLGDAEQACGDGAARQRRRRSGNGLPRALRARQLRRRSSIGVHDNNSADARHSAHHPAVGTLDALLCGELGVRRTMARPAGRGWPCWSRGSCCPPRSAACHAADAPLHAGWPRTATAG